MSLNTLGPDGSCSRPHLWQNKLEKVATVMWCTATWGHPTSKHHSGPLITRPIMHQPTNSTIQQYFGNRWALISFVAMYCALLYCSFPLQHMSSTCNAARSTTASAMRYNIASMKAVNEARRTTIQYNTIQYKTYKAPYVTKMLFVGAGMTRD